jgi:hypothetical protein
MRLLAQRRFRLRGPRLRWLRAPVLCALVLLAAAGFGALGAGSARADASAAAAGFTLAAEMKHGAYRLPAGAPDVVVHAPASFDPKRPLHLVVFLHGYNGCAAVLAGEGPIRCKPRTPEREGWELARHHDAAGTPSLFIVPQLAFLQRNSRPGAFGRRGGFRAFLEELLGETLAKPLGGARRMRDIASLTLVAHSAGYQAAISIAERGGVRSQLRAIVLLDALYGETARYGRLLETSPAKGLRFVSLYLQRGTPSRENQRLYWRLRRARGADEVMLAKADELEAAIASHPVVFGPGRPPHRLLPQHHLTELLRALFEVIVPAR